MGVIEALPAELGVQPHRLTVAQYHRMAEVGVLARDARVELVEGVIVNMAPIGSRHAAAVKRLNALLTQAVGAPEVWIVDLEDSLVRCYRSPQAGRYADITATETPGLTPVAMLAGVVVNLTQVGLR